MERKKGDGTTGGSFSMPFIDMPREEEDPFFVRSFRLEEETEILSFFAEYGFVVVRDVLSDQECDETVADIWDIVEGNSTMRRDDPSSWNDWPKNSLESHGVPTKLPVFTRVALRNRQNANVFKIFHLLFGSPLDKPKDLWVNHDRYALFRPTVGSEEQARWQTHPTLHLDMDPWTFISPDGVQTISATLNSLDYSLDGGNLHHFLLENNELHPLIHGDILLQGSINLLDNYEEDGGFICVPGFHRYFQEWANSSEAKSLSEECKARKIVVFPSHDKLQQQAVRVPMRKGSLVVWDQRLPHGAVPNQSTNFRCAQFIKYFVPGKNLDSQRAKNRAATLQRLIEDTGFASELNAIGQLAFGLTNATESAATSSGKGKSRTSGVKKAQPKKEKRREK